MRTKSLKLLSSLALIGSVLVLIGLVGVSSPNGRQDQLREQDSSPDRTIVGQLHRAKSTGVQVINIPGGHIWPQAIKNLDQMITDFKAVIAEPIEEQVYLADLNRLKTVYKFKIIEELSPGHPPSCAQCDSPPAVPDALLPLIPDEIVVAVPGGDITVDGIRLTYITNLTVDLATGSVAANTPVETWAPTDEAPIASQLVAKPKRFLLFLMMQSPVCGRIASPLAVSLVAADGRLGSVTHKPHMSKVLQEASIASLDDFKRYTRQVRALK
jgi:hypothetical protein